MSNGSMSRTVDVRTASLAPRMAAALLALCAPVLATAEAKGTCRGVIDYQEIVQESVGATARAALQLYRTREPAACGHALTLALRTTEPGVEIGKALSRIYPTGITIVLEHRFADLVVEPGAFGVTLDFCGVPKRLRFPYSAVIGVWDAPHKFGQIGLPKDEITALVKMSSISIEELLGPELDVMRRLPGSGDLFDRDGHLRVTPQVRAIAERCALLVGQQQTFPRLDATERTIIRHLDKALQDQGYFQ